MKLNQIEKNIWTYEGEVVLFYGYPYPTRMTVIKLANGRLWVHSPEKLTSDLQKELQALGQVSYLVSPNKLHHLYLDEWKKAYPQAKNYAAPGLEKKRKDFRFDQVLTDIAEVEWQGEIEQIIFAGSLAMDEVVFFHNESKTLILTDLIENFPQDHFRGWQKIAAKLAGIIGPNGKAPIDYRLSFMFGKHKARQALKIIKNWQPDNIIISHGECIYGNGAEFIERSFSWLE